MASSRGTCQHCLAFCPSELISPQRIQRWFRHHGKKSLAAQKSDPMAKIVASFTDAVTKPPRRPGVVQFYQRTHYDSRIKPAVEAEYSRLCQEAAASNTPSPVKIAIVNAVAKQKYKSESAAFKAQLNKDLEADHQRRLVQHNASAAKDTPPETAEEFHR